MAYGLVAANFANPLLNTLRGTSFSVGTVWVQLHTGDPSATGLSNLSLNTTRQQVNFAVAAGGVISLSAAPNVWNMTGSETLVALSFWSLATGGVPYLTCPLTSSQAVGNGDVVTLTSFQLTFAPLAV